MSLELTLLISLVGMIFLSTLGDSETGFKAQFQNNKPALAIRMEKNMTIGRCFQVAKNASTTPCENTLWRAASSR